MKYLFFAGLFALLFSNDAMAQLPPAKMDSPSMEPLKPLEYAKEAPKATEAPPLPIPVKPVPLQPQKSFYLHPGILVYFNGKWEGSDHLYNLTNQISVQLSIVKPENEILDISESELKKVVEDIFVDVGIRPQTLVAPGRAPLPVFQIEIFVYPIERGFVACCEGRLFESVILERFKMDPNMAFQAITWEKQQLQVSPKAQFKEHIIKTVTDIADSFAERFDAYQRIKSRS